MTTPGSQTSAALANFTFPDLPSWAQDPEAPVPTQVSRALGQVKAAALFGVQESETRWPPQVWSTLGPQLEQWCSKPLSLVVPLEQGGAGTSLHRNWLDAAVAELAKLELEGQTSLTLDPLEDLNRYQSTNDVVPTALTIVVLTILQDLEARVIALQEALVAKEKEAQGVLIVGRTELQDALPMGLDQVFAAWGGMVARDRWRLSKVQERVRTVALGGTALGTCYFAPRPYLLAAERHLRRLTGLPLSRSQNLPDEVAHGDKYAEAAGAMARVAENLWKIAGDLSLYTSSLCGELQHPHVQDGSTIMASKTNPVFLELIRGLSLSAQGEAHKISLYTQNGQLQLNPFTPFLFRSFLRMGADLWKALTTLAHRLLPALTWDAAKLESRLLASPALLNSLRDLVPYATLQAASRQTAHLPPPTNWAELQARLQPLLGLPPQVLHRRLCPQAFQQPYIAPQQTTPAGDNP